MTKADLTQRVCSAIDRRGAAIIEMGETIRRHPELGFKEFKTAKLVAQTFERMGLAPRTGLALTGVRADAPGRAGDGPTLALFGELDGLVVVGHPVADPETGAAHACAAVGRQVMAQARPPLTRPAYLEFQRRMSRRGTYDGGRN